MINITNLIDQAKCFETVRDLRWQSNITCPFCISEKINKRGHHETCKYRQRYVCLNCKKRFDDLSDTIFEGSHIPLITWILCSYFMGLNLSNSQIAEELDINNDTAQNMCTKLRKGIAVKKEVKELETEVEFDEVYVVSGHKGQEDEVKKKS